MQQKIDVLVAISHLPERRTLCHMYFPENDQAARDIMNVKKL